MGKKRYYIHALPVILFSLLTAFVACSSKKKTVLAEIGDEKIYLSDYETQFLKTVNSLDSAKRTTMDERQAFLDLLIKFRLKVKDARERGLLESEDIQKDLNEYKKNFLSTFLIDKKVVEPNIKDLYDRKKYEVRASHILINLTPTPTPEDSAKAFEKAHQVIERLKNGDSFEQVAMEMSDDPSAKQNGGDLYYFTGGMTVPEFEDVVFKMKKGEYTKEPVRTQFGLHVVKLTDKKERYDAIRASHIMVQDKRDTLGQVIDSLGTYAKAQSILDRIKNGEDFGKLASELSEDPSSGPKGGDLGFFDRRRMVQAFDSAAFSLKVGEVSGLVKTPYGWHIIKLTEVKEYEPFDKQKEKLKSEFKRGAQYKTAYTNYMEELRKKHRFAIKPEGMQVLTGKIDASKPLSAQKLDSLFTGEQMEVVVAEFAGDNQVKIKDLKQYIEMNRDNVNDPATVQNLETNIKGASEIPMLNFAAFREGVEKDTEYIALLTEYENGLLSFKIDQEELWSKIKLNNDDLMRYYDANKAKYAFTENNETKYRTFDEVKSEISNTLQQETFKNMEKSYIESLKQKYPVVVKNEVLQKAFTED
jgi:peptidyl-prolyl cis-trans isomerase SurA